MWRYENKTDLLSNRLRHKINRPKRDDVWYKKYIALYNRIPRTAPSGAVNWEQVTPLQIPEPVQQVLKPLQKPLDLAQQLRELDGAPGEEVRYPGHEIPTTFAVGPIPTAALQLDRLPRQRHNNRLPAQRFGSHVPVGSLKYT